MTEDSGTADAGLDAETGRELCRRAESVGLAAVDVDDAELLHGWRSDPVAAYEIGIWPRSLTAMRERIERDTEDDDRDDFLVLLPDGTPIGHIALSNQNIVNGTAQVELMLAPSIAGKATAPPLWTPWWTWRSANCLSTASRWRPIRRTPPPSRSSPSRGSCTKGSAAPPVSTAAAATTLPCSHCSGPSGRP